MKTGAVFVSLALMVANVICMPQGFGDGHPLSCTPKQQERNGFKCMRNFYRALQKNPGTTCKDHFNGYITCVAKNSLKCSGVKEEDMNLFLSYAFQGMKASGALKGMQKGICDFTYTRGASEGDACNIVGKMKSMNCIKKFRSQFLKDRGNPELCRAYRGALECAFNARQKYCPDTVKEHDRKEALSQENNPFC